jgi:hypothetical protein
VWALSALSAVNHCPATQAIADAGKKSAKSFAPMSRLAGFPRRKRTRCDKILMGKKVALHVEHGSTSDKRDDVLPARYVLAGVPFVILRPGPWPRLPPAGAREVWCFANCQNCPQDRGRLSAPWLYGDFYSAQARPRGAQEYCGKGYSFILMSLYRSLHPSHHADKQ